MSPFVDHVPLKFLSPSHAFWTRLLVNSEPYVLVLFSQFRVCTLAALLPVHVMSIP
jgi:hypothetical protein